MKSSKQSSCIEYGLIASLIAVAIVGALLVLEPSLNVVFFKIQAAV